MYYRQADYLNINLNTTTLGAAPRGISEMSLVGSE